MTRDARPAASVSDSAATVPIVIFAVAVIVNAPWELAQMALGLFEGLGSTLIILCVACSLGDGLLVLGIFAAGWIVFRRPDWFAHPGAAGYILMVAVGFAVAVLVEWRAITTGRWSYSSTMPILPGLEVGMTPVLQMLVLPPLIFGIAAAWLRWCRITAR